MQLRLEKAVKWVKSLFFSESFFSEDEYQNMDFFHKELMKCFEEAKIHVASKDWEEYGKVAKRAAVMERRYRREVLGHYSNKN